MWINNTDDDVWMLTSKAKESGTWTKLSAGALGGIETITGDSGGAISSDEPGNINILGGTLTTVTGDSGTNTLTIDVSSTNVIWTVDTTTPINVNAGEGHISDAVGVITYNLPALCSLGDRFSFANVSNGFIVQTQVGQTIIFGDQSTSAGGSVDTTEAGDTIKIICYNANTGFIILNSIGNLTIV